MISLIPLLGAATAGALWLIGHRRIAYIRHHYPDDWEKAGYNPARMRQVRQFNLEHSLQHGPLSQSQDAALKHYRRLELATTLLGGGAMVALLIRAFF